MLKIIIILVISYAISNLYNLKTDTAELCQNIIEIFINKTIDRILIFSFGMNHLC